MLGAGVWGWRENGVAGGGSGHIEGAQVMRQVSGTHEVGREAAWAAGEMGGRQRARVKCRLLQGGGKCLAEGAEHNQERSEYTEVHTQRRVSAWPGVPLAGGGAGRWRGAK